MIIKVNGVDLYYQKLGQGQPLILLHGHHLDGGMYSKVIAPLSLYYTVYTLDMRGHGLSGGDGAEHYQTEVEDLAVFIKELGLEQPYVFGYDSGGLVTLMLASQQPDILGKAVVAGVFIDGRGIHKYHYLTEGVRRFLRFDRDSRVELTESYMEPESLEQIERRAASAATGLVLSIAVRLQYALCDESVLPHPICPAETGATRILAWPMLSYRLT